MLRSKEIPGNLVKWNWNNIRMYDTHLPIFVVLIMPVAAIKMLDNKGVSKILVSPDQQLTNTS